MISFTIECPKCYGEGAISNGIYCTRPASDCCGGCETFTKCEDCDGTGKRWIDLSEEQIKDIVQAISFDGLGEAQEIINL